MKYKWIVMQELEDSMNSIPHPYRIVNTEEQAEILCTEAETKNPGYIFWYTICEEEE